MKTVFLFKNSTIFLSRTAIFIILFDFLTEVFVLLFLMAASLLVRTGLLKVYGSRLLTIENFKVVGIPLQQIDENSNVMDILQGNEKFLIRNLIINSENYQLKKNLRFLNLDGVGFKGLAARRRKNKFFMKCLSETYTHHPSTLLWLKNNNEFDICRRILSDWKFSGEILKSRRFIHRFLKILHFC